MATNIPATGAPLQVAGASQPLCEIKGLPTELIEETFLKLSAHQAAKTREVCKEWNTLIHNDYFYGRLLDRDFPNYKPVPSSKIPYQIQHEILTRLKEHPMSPEIVEALGGQEFVETLPLLDIGTREGETKYIDFISPNELTAPIMRGIDKYRRPFIVFCVGKTVLLQGMRRPEKAGMPVVIFQRYSDNKSHWSSGEKCSPLVFSSLPSTASGLQTIKTLIAGTCPEGQLLTPEERPT